MTLSATSTIPHDPADRDTERRARRLRRAGLACFTLFVAAGATGLLGVRAATITRSDGALEATLDYPAGARPSLPVPWRISIGRTGGFDTAIEVRIATRWLDSLDVNGILPEPAASSSDGGDTIWTFDPPEGETFVVNLDARIDPGTQWRRDGRVEVRHDDETIRLGFTTWVLP